MYLQWNIHLALSGSSGLSSGNKTILTGKMLTRTKQDCSIIWPPERQKLQSQSTFNPFKEVNVNIMNSIVALNKVLGNRGIWTWEFSCLLITISPSQLLFDPFVPPPWVMPCSSEVPLLYFLKKFQCVVALVCPLLKTWPATQACALTGN